MDFLFEVKYFVFIVKYFIYIIFIYEVFLLGILDMNLFEYFILNILN